MLEISSKQSSNKEKESSEPEGVMIPYPDKPNYAKCKLCFQNGDERVLSKKSFSRHVKRFHLNNGNAFSYSNKGVLEVQKKKDVKLRHLKGKKEVGYLKNKLNLKQCPKLFMKQIVKVHKINPKILKLHWIQILNFLNMFLYVVNLLIVLENLLSKFLNVTWSLSLK